MKAIKLDVLIINILLNFQVVSFIYLQFFLDQFQFESINPNHVLDCFIVCGLLPCHNYRIVCKLIDHTGHRRLVQTSSAVLCGCTRFRRYHHHLKFNWMVSRNNIKKKYESNDQFIEERDLISECCNPMPGLSVR